MPEGGVKPIGNDRRNGISMVLNECLSGFVCHQQFFRNQQQPLDYQLRIYLIQVIGSPKRGWCSVIQRTGLSVWLVSSSNWLTLVSNSTTWKMNLPGEVPRFHTLPLAFLKFMKHGEPLQKVLHHYRNSLDTQLLWHPDKQITAHLILSLTPGHSSYSHLSYGLMPNDRIA